jgi:hypothetical protein
VSNRIQTIDCVDRGPKLKALGVKIEVIEKIPLNGHGGAGMTEGPMFHTELSQHAF